MDERFEEACENLSYIEYLADYLTFADEEEGFEVVKSMKETGYLEDLKYLSGSRDEEDALLQWGGSLMICPFVGKYLKV